MSLSQIPRNLFQGLTSELLRKAFISPSSRYDLRCRPSVQPLLQAREASRFFIPKASGSVSPLPREDINWRGKNEVPDHFRKVFPEFLPDPTYVLRNKLKEQMEREDMLKRRNVVAIPEFYVGSILAVTISDANAFGKMNRFVGLCISRGGSGLRAWFTLRNIVDHIGVEILYEMYCPLILNIEVLVLEKRLDEDLSYLRDCHAEYSTFPFDLSPEPLPPGAPVPINPTKVKFKPRPWRERWERRGLNGIEPLRLPVKFIVKGERQLKPWEQFDLMRDYRATIPEEEQAKIYRELAPHMPKLEASRRQLKKIKIKERKF